ncbi:MAG: serine/threonine-protein kinase, partial [Thermoanaerobaculia bacterium]|nr:serine/threonine-protein kinase [Thermoanaerobaculia bacterium]
MTVASGTRLGPYEITAKLGEGGMGEVWRAKDSQLGRDVALKVLPEEFTADAERAARFEREAKVLASLNHPNIAQIYGFEASGETRALVMELVEGPTLAERLEKGALPFDESLFIARQIAEALEEAHEKGIIHRDLKPQNVKASIEGKVKVLDFGLAKAMDPSGTASGSPSASRLAASPTLTLGATVQGMILGTAAYMAPEQARGTGVDARADIWAFGVVLYEMLSGRTTFAAETVPDTLAAVLTREIDWSALPETTPPAIRRLLRRCLERKPKNRLHHIADARIVIDEVLAGVSDPAAAPSVAPAAAAPTRPRWLVPAVVAAALVVGLVAGRWLQARGTASSFRAIDVALAVPAGYALQTQDLVELTISPDGRRQVVGVLDAEGESHLLLRDLDETEPRLLPGTAGARSPFLSPDGRSVGFFIESELRRVALAGGPPLRIAGTVNALASRGATWSRDGFVYFLPDTATGLQRVRENGGAVETVTRPDAARQERTHRWPAVLADGSAVLFTSDTMASTEYYDDARIEAVRVATGERKVLVEGASQARFLPPDRLVFARQGALFAV